MTRQERMELCELSLQVYGRRYAWQKMLRKGELVEEKAVSNNGNPLTIKRLKHLTLEDVLARMEKVIADKQEAAAKAAEEAAKQTQGEANGPKEENQENSGSSEVQPQQTEG